MAAPTPSGDINLSSADRLLLEAIAETLASLRADVASMHSSVASIRADVASSVERIKSIGQMVDYESRRPMSFY